MCGIFCQISHDTDDSKSSAQWDACKQMISARGPDGISEKIGLLYDDWFGHFAASVLWMQGPKPRSQPAVDSSGNILLWNGDIFSGPLAGDNNVCDTDVVLSALQTSLDITLVLRQVQGPYSFIYYQKATKLLYFGRDVIGRHSLLLMLDTNERSLTLTSVASKKLKNAIELPAIGIFAISLKSPRMNLSCFPWKDPDLKFTDVIETLENHLSVDIDIKDTISLSKDIFTPLHFHPNINDLDYLENSIVNGNYYATLENLLDLKHVRDKVEHLSDLLHKAVEVRIKRMPMLCKNCIKRTLNKEELTCNHSKVGILFSGGLDSAILALIADKYVPQTECIDLINVAFEKTSSITEKSSGNNRNIDNHDQFNVPDRVTGKQTLSELLEICPDRKWNFIEVNISQTELQTYRSCRISDLLYPLCTILDESLGCAVWFASRAKGLICNITDVYESPCRVLLLGMGADELFGGYMRHRTTLKHKGWDALAQELNLELARISERNLGRDDRIVSDHGRQGRLPYLDENLVEYVQQLKPCERCYPTDKMPSGLGDKLLLRLLACHLGFKNTANFPKRAFQFGSRIANSKENAKDISNRL